MVVLVLGGILVTRFVTTSRDMVTAGQSSDGTDGSGGSGGTDTDPDASGSGSDRDSRSGGSGSGARPVPGMGVCIVKQAEQGEFIQNLDIPEVVAEFMYRTECGAPGSYRVLAVYDDPGPLPAQFDGPITPCVNHGAPNATMVFQWGVAGKPEIREGEFQRGICLIEAG